MKRLGSAHAAQDLHSHRLYFLEVVKARAVTVLCKSGPERERELGRLGADIETQQRHRRELQLARCPSR